MRPPGIRVLWLATAVNQLSIGMQQVILGWVVLNLTGSSAMVGVAYALRSAPNLVLGFVAGAIADRLDRRTVMRLSAFAMAAGSLVVAWIMWLDRVAIWHVLAYAVVLGAFRAFDTAARQSYVYDVGGAENVVRGLAFNATAQRLGAAIGALVGGWILERWGASAAFVAMALCFATGGGLLFALRHRGAAAPTEREPLWQNIKAYIEALRTQPVLRNLIFSTAAAEVIGFSHQTLLPILAKEILQVGASGLGVLIAFRFLGGLIGAGGLAVVRNVTQQGILLFIALALFGVGQMLLSQVAQLWTAMVCVMWINIMASAADILHQTLLQQHVANAQRGRAMGSWIIGTGAAPLGHLQIGYVAAATSVSVALMCNGVALVALPCLLAWRLPQLRRL